WDEIVESSEKVMEAMRKKGGFVDIDTTYRTGKPQLDVVIDRDRAANLGIPAASVGQVLRAYLGGDQVADFKDGGKTYEVRLRLPDEIRGDEEKLGSLTVRSATGELVELRNFAK